MPPKRVVPKRASSTGKTVTAGTAAKSGAKSTAKASAKASAKSAAASSAGPVAVPEVDPRLEGLLEELFLSYDKDRDGQIERVEMLEGEEQRLGSLEFGPKERKATIAWFKEAGAEGTPTAGMFLSKDKWKAAMMQMVVEASAADQQKPSAWLEEKYEKMFPKVAPCVGGSASGGGAGEQVPLTPPDYPITVAFKDFMEKVQEAQAFGKRALVLSSGRPEVETFLNYRHTNLLDAKMYVSRVFGLKNMSLEEAVADANRALTNAMNSQGFTKPLHIRLNNSALDWSRFCCDEFPTDVFDGELWTIGNAHKRGFFDDGHKFLLEMEDEKRWKEFNVVLTSTFDLESAQEFLSDKIPHFDKLAILVIDPDSMA